MECTIYKYSIPASWFLNEEDSECIHTSRCQRSRHAFCRKSQGHGNLCHLRVRVMVFNATFKNILVKSWRSVFVC